MGRADFERHAKLHIAALKILNFSTRIKKQNKIIFRVFCCGQTNEEYESLSFRQVLNDASQCSIVVMFFK